MNHRFTKRARIAIAVAALGILASACEVSTAATRLNVIDADEEAFFSNGDEPYIAVIKWRVTPGTPGSTQVSLLTEVRDELATRMDDGDSVAIPASAGAVTFDNVTPVAFQQLLTGKIPELMGTVVIAMESDNSSWGAVNSIFRDVEAALRVELAAQIEPLTITDLTNQTAVANALSTAAANVEAAVKPSFFEAVALFFAAFGDPDDVVGIGFTVYVASAGPLSNVINSSLLANLPAGSTGGTWSDNLNPITGTLNFDNGPANYSIDIVANARATPPPPPPPTDPPFDPNNPCWPDPAPPPGAQCP
jgi:hypothetical protein